MLNEQICLQRQQMIDERCRRGRKDIEKLETKQEEEEKRSQKLEELNIKMGEILKKHDEKISNHDIRIGKLETVSGDRWNSVVNFTLAGVVGALVAAAMHMLLGG
ncbi:MAG: hypothetical protein GX485_07780 [Clostridiales bacterium]|nr:hypothetical protein [Clostridiales bacterium]